MLSIDSQWGTFNNYQLTKKNLSKKKNFGEVLNPFELPTGKNGKYFLKNGGLKFLEQVICLGWSIPWFNWHFDWSTLQYTCIAFGKECSEILYCAITLGLTLFHFLLMKFIKMHMHTKKNILCEFIKTYFILFSANEACFANIWNLWSIYSQQNRNRFKLRYSVVQWRMRYRVPEI